MTDSDQGRPQGAFSPEMVAVINRAYEIAIERLGIIDTHSDRRAALARRVMDLAGAGEANENRLCDRAVAPIAHDDKVRARAQQIWEAEDRPNGRQNEHWRRAGEEIGDPPST